MPLEISLDALAFSQGKIVLSGLSAKPIGDAALFFTALRLACTQQNPYFSLDPDDGALWNKQGQEAFTILWDRIRDDFDPKLPIRRKYRTETGLTIRTVSAKRDFPALWRELAPRFPNLCSKLVFHPEWLSDTRFGEIFYKADVLLKELASGVPVLTPGNLRASSVKGYLAADAERAAKMLLVAGAGKQSEVSQWRGSRLWFDIAPGPPAPVSVVEAAETPAAKDPQVLALLQARGLMRPTEATLASPTVTRDGNILDLSGISPRMYVRIHDAATNQDLSNHDPDLDGLATDVSDRFAEYAGAYDELRKLREVFRYYVAAEHIDGDNEVLCQRLRDIPLLDAERVTSPLPQYHPSELFITVANYEVVTRRYRRALSATASSINGGVAITGDLLSPANVRQGHTKLTSELRKMIHESVSPGTADPNRKLISFILDDTLSAPLHVAGNSPAAGYGASVTRSSPVSPTRAVRYR